MHNKQEQGDIASMADEASKTTETPAAPPSSGGNLVITIVTVFNLLITLGAVAYLYLDLERKKQAAVTDIDQSPATPQAVEDEEAEGTQISDKEKREADEEKLNDSFARMLKLEQFTVNLSTSGSVYPKYARVNVALQVANEDVDAEVNQRMPQVRNAIIDLFNSKKPADLATAEGRNYIKEEIKNAINGFLVSGKVKGVYFTNFAVGG